LKINKFKSINSHQLTFFSQRKYLFTRPMEYENQKIALKWWSRHKNWCILFSLIKMKIFINLIACFLSFNQFHFMLLISNQNHGMRMIKGFILTEIQNLPACGNARLGKFLENYCVLRRFLKSFCGWRSFWELLDLPKFFERFSRLGKFFFFTADSAPLHFKQWEWQRISF
jgi:hypothetical protein